MALMIVIMKTMSQKKFAETQSPWLVTAFRIDINLALKSQKYSGHFMDRENYQKKCLDRVCLNATMVCDGIVHCNEAEDERNCGNVTYDGEKTCTGLWCQLAGILGHINNQSLIFIPFSSL